MIDMQGGNMLKLCENHDRRRQAKYRLIQRKPLFCQEHKTDNMTDVRAKLCEHEWCDKYPTFGMEGGGHMRKKHKTEDMIYLLKISCKVDRCDTTPTFSIEASKATHCKKHKTEDMIDLKKHAKWTGVIQPLFLALKAAKLHIVQHIKRLI
jgi:hypothetical protein